MKARDIMTAKVLTCSPDTEVIALAQLMAANGISGVPVVADGKLVGMVSEGDLLRREELGDAQRNLSWWLRLLGHDQPASEYVKSQGQHVRDVMTKEVVTVSLNTPLDEIAEMFERLHIKRAPVLDENKQVVGIVSRANFVQAVANAARPETPAERTDDESIYRSLIEELSSHSWWRGGTNSLTVSNGVAHFWGYYSEREELDAARVAAENIAGVRAVEEHRSRYPLAYA